MKCSAPASFREIEKQIGRAHESPQVIVLRNGQVVWNASHFEITADAVAEAVREHERRKAVSVSRDGRQEMIED